MTHNTVHNYTVTALVPAQSNSAAPLQYTIFNRLIEPIGVCDEPEKNEHPNFYDHFILANHLILDNQNTIIVF